MKWFKNLTIGKKILLGFVMTLLFTTIMGYVSIINLQNIDTLNYELYEVNTEPLGDLAIVSQSFMSLRVLVRDMYINEKNKVQQEKTLMAIEEQNRMLDKSLAEFDKSIQEKEIRQGFEKLRMLLGEYRSLSKQIETLSLAGKSGQGLILSQEEGSRLAEQIIQEIKILMDLKIQQAQQKAANNHLRVKTTINNMIIIFIIGILCAIIITIYMSRTIIEPLKTALVTANGVSARDLTVEIQEEKRLDEPGVLLESIRVMCINLRSEIKQIMEGASVLSSSAVEISASMAQFTSTSSETAAAVSQVTVTMEELSRTAQLSSQKANYVSDIAQKAVDVSLDGQKSLEKTVGSMEGIKKKMDSIAKSIISLSEQSQSIGEIISTVEDIAEQTNLLAVNASIEAAKAGEYGKGFTVVAQEIKNLSHQSKRATAQITSILNEIQKATGIAVMATEQGAKAVESGIAQSSETGESILALTNTINEAAQSVTQIALSSQQQTLGVDQVASALENIQRASLQNLNGAKQLEDSANNLEVLGQKLKQLVGHYRV